MKCCCRRLEWRWLFALRFIFFNRAFTSPGEEVRAEFFMEELNNGVKLCRLIGVLQTKITQSCPAELCKVGHTAAGGAGRATTTTTNLLTIRISLQCSRQHTWEPWCRRFKRLVVISRHSCSPRGTSRASGTPLQGPSSLATTPPTSWPGAATSAWRRPTCLSRRASVRAAADLAETIAFLHPLSFLRVFLHNAGSFKADVES